MPERGRFILCADDYGQDPAISAGIVELAKVGRLSATSAMTTTARWPQDAVALRALSDGIAVGLHLNLTHGTGLGPLDSLTVSRALPDVGRVIGLALRRRIDRTELAAEIHRQLDAFEAAMDMPPDHLDGHQHVHALPQIRGVVMAVLRARYGERMILLRDPGDGLVAILGRGSVAKALTVAALTKGFRTQAEQAGFLTNAGFSGFSPFDARPYVTEFRSFLRHAGKRPMIMCHPGHAAGSDDPLTARRPQELRYLAEAADLPDLVWHPKRGADGLVDWPS
ncbi:MAG: ChbG/HpnK family deacetylase [bacterium]